MATETATLQIRLKAFVQPDTASESPGFVQPGEYPVVTRQIDYPNADTDYAKINDATLGEVWICSRWKNDTYAEFTSHAVIAPEGEVNEPSLTSLITDYDGFRYNLQNAYYPYPLPGINIKVAPPNPPQNNCCTFVEGILVKTWADNFPDFTWNIHKHQQMMISSGDGDLFSPVTAVVESDMATPIDDVEAVPPPWTVIQGWNAGFTGGHTFLLVDHYAPTDGMLTLESNMAFKLDGVGFRGIGMASDFGNRPPDNWWEIAGVQTWENLKSRYPNRKMAKLKIVTNRAWARLG